MKTSRYSWEKEMMLDGEWCENVPCFCSISCIVWLGAARPVWIWYDMHFVFFILHFMFSISFFLSGKDCHRIRLVLVAKICLSLIFVTFNMRFAIFWSLTTVHPLYGVSYFGYQFHVAIARFSEKNLQIMGTHHQYLWQNVTSLEKKFLFDVWKKTCPCPLPPY